MKLQSFSRTSLALSLFLTFSIPNTVPTYAAGSCPFGTVAIDFDEYEEPICEDMYWSVEKQDDGFDKVVLATMNVDNSNIGGSDYGFSLIVRCTSKKLEVYASSDGYEMFYESAYTSGGGIKAIFDSGSTKNYRFSKSTDNEALFISSAKTFATALAKAKKSVSLKFSSSRGNVTLQFPVSDFAQSKKTFASGGCKF